MVEKENKAARRLSRYDHEELRFLRFRGLTFAAIARRMGVSEYAVRYRLQEYDLDAPIGQVEAVRLELWAAFRETSRRLEQSDVSDAEHARLCGAQVKQAMALLRVLPVETKIGEDEMANDVREKAQSLETMSDEDMRNELRRLVGLETRSADGKQGPCPDNRRGEAICGDTVSGAGDGGAEAADKG